MGFAITALALWLNPSITFGQRRAVTVIGLCLFAYLPFEAASTREALGVLRHELLRDNAELATPRNRCAPKYQVPRKVRE